MAMRPLRNKFYTFMCLLLCVSSMNIPLNQYKIIHAVEVQIGNSRQESGSRVRRHASDIRSKYFFSVTHEPQNSEAKFHEVRPLLRQFSNNSILVQDNSDLSEILKGYALFVKKKEPVEEISNIAEVGVSGSINIQQENSYDHQDDKPDEVYGFGLDLSKYEMKKVAKPFYDDHIHKEYIWQDHHHLNDEDNYKHHDNGHLHENHGGNFENHDVSKGEVGESNYGFRTSFHKGFHGYYDDEQHSDYHNGNGDHVDDHHDANFVFGDYNDVQNYGSNKDLEKDQGHKIVSKADGFYNVFHKDEFKKAHDFYNNEKESGRFFKSGEHKELFENSEGEIKEEGPKHDGGGGEYSMNRNSGVRGNKQHYFKGADGIHEHGKYYDKRKSHGKKRGWTHRRKYDFEDR